MADSNKAMSSLKTQTHYNNAMQSHVAAWRLPQVSKTIIIIVTTLFASMAVKAHEINLMSTCVS